MIYLIYILGFIEMQILIICNLIHCWEQKIKKKTTKCWIFHLIILILHTTVLSREEKCVCITFLMKF